MYRPEQLELSFRIVQMLYYIWDVCVQYHT